MVLRRRALLVVVASLLGCSGANSTANTPGGADATVAKSRGNPASTQQSEADIAPPEPEGRPRVELVDAGTPPLSKLRYNFVAGSVQTSAMTMSMTIQTAVNDRLVPGLPPVVTDMVATYRTSSVDDQGTAERVGRIESFTVRPNDQLPPEVYQQMQERLATLIGFEFSEVVSARGVLVGVETQARDAVAPDIQNLFDGLMDSMGQVMVPLPVEPVGQGASWNTLGDVRLSGMSMIQQSTVSLDSRSGDTVELSIEFTQTAEPGPVEQPGLPPGYELRLLSVSTKGKGQQKVNLATSTGNASTQFRARTRMEMRPTKDDSQRPRELASDMRIEVDFKMTPGEPGTAEQPDEAKH